MGRFFLQRSGEEDKRMDQIQECKELIIIAGICIIFLINNDLLIIRLLTVNIVNI